MTDKKEENNLEFLDWCQEFYNESLELRKKEPKEKPMGPGKWDAHLDDFFHPDNIFNSTRNQPIGPEAAQAVRLQAEQHLARGETEKAAKLLLLSQARLFQHHTLIQYEKRQLKAARKTNVALALPEDKDMFDSDNDDDDQGFEDLIKKRFKFESFDDTSVIQNLKWLPESWTIVQISSQDPMLRFKKQKKDEPTTHNPELTILRLQGGRIRVAKCPGPAAAGCNTFLKEFVNILSEVKHLMKNAQNEGLDKPNPDKEVNEALSKHWQRRNSYDERMVALVSSIEKKWLGKEVWNLVGTLKDPAQITMVDTVIHGIIRERFAQLGQDELMALESLLSLTGSFTKDELSRHLEVMVPSLNKEDVTKLVVEARKKLSKLSVSKRQPVLLILDPNVQQLPWESLPFLERCRQPFSRLPSLPFLHALWTAHSNSSERGSVVSSGVAQDNVFYVVNPEKNLPKTEERLNKALQDFENWEGVSGSAPSKEKLSKEPLFINVFLSNRGCSALIITM